ncbi:MAG: nucleotidyltransferase domain-containing protein [Roseiflexaceae bacterium]|nr:nucleotidyltransferase domain-containing protein [Roseiflexaceae bacterium]
MSQRLRQLMQICQQGDIEILYVFGSRSLEVYDWLHSDQPLAASSSDIDIGAKALPTAQWYLDEKVRLAQAFEELFAVPRVDFVSFGDADAFFAANIVRGERLYAANEHAADEFDLYVLRRAGDLAPFERERLDHVFGVMQ